MVRLPSRKLFGSFSRKFIFILFVIGALIYIWLPYKNYPFTSLVGNVVTAPKKNKSLPFPMHQYPLNHASIINDLKDAMHHSWKAYVDYAWGMDEVLVLTKMGTRWMDAGLTMRPAAGVYKILNEVSKLSGLLPIEINMYRPAHSSVGTITLGARGDSYYEYLLKVWVQTGKVSEWLRNEYITAVGGVKERLIRQSVPNGLIFVGELHASEFSTKMDHLVCFLPATLAYGYLHGMPEEHLHLAESLMETCFHLYKDTQTGLSAELVYFNLANFDRPDFYIKRSDAFNLLRPETVESLFYLYRITKNPKYQEWGLAIFRAFNASCRITPAGFAPIQDVQSSVPHHRDKMESFWTAETLKYLLLLFDEQLAAKFDLTEWVFNTEAHPFPLSKADALSVIQDLYNFNL